MVITNNPMLGGLTGAVYDPEYSLMDVLILARDRVHLGHRLLTHPLSGSVKPNETPYKSVTVSDAPEKNIDIESLRVIEAAIAMAEKLLADSKPKAWSGKTLADFQLIDYSLNVDKGGRKDG